MKPLAIILGSSSPRRRDLLAKVGFTFQVVSPDVEECRREGEDVEAYVRRNAREKALWVRDNVSAAEPCVVIGADTVVVLEGELMEKPRSIADATRMLTGLSGNTHTVHSGVCIAGKGDGVGEIIENFSVSTHVTLKATTPAEIAAYIASGEPMDKAGAYAAQGIGSYMVKSLHGSYTNVVGLPIAEVVETLAEKFGLTPWGGPISG